MEENKPKLLNLFLTMLKIGAFTFGGGYAMVPLLYSEFVKKKGWANSEELTDILALAQSIPGAIAVNSAIIIGYRLEKIKGALLSALGIALPSLISLTIVTYLYEQFSQNIYIAGALAGIRACVVALLVSAVIRLSKPFRRDIFGIILFIAAFLASVIFDIHSILIILVGLITGLVMYLIERRRNKC